MAMEIWLLVFVSFSTMIVIIAFFFLVFIYLSSHPYPNFDRVESETTYFDPKENEFKPFPFGLTAKPEVELSVIIPAYNESERLPKMLIESMDYLLERKKKNKKFSFEVIVVDDGSVDDTYNVALHHSKMYSSDVLRVLKMQRNRGKGAAVRHGMLSARGQFLLFVDADGATKFANVEFLESKMKTSIASRWNGSMAVICGSRAHLEKNVMAKRSVFRNMLMYGFHFAVWLLCVKGIRDTQCGFKLFSRSAARLLFMNQHVERWAFDVDILYLAKQFDIEVVEVPVNWHEVEGSKLVPVFSWLQMAKDLLFIRLRYGLGAWKIEPAHRLH